MPSLVAVLKIYPSRTRIVPSSHGAWLARCTRPALFWLRPGEGHISVLSSATAPLDWLSDHAAGS